MLLLPLLLTASISPAHAFDRLPAESQAQSIMAAAKDLKVRHEARLVQVALASDAGLDAIFAPAGTSGTIAPLSGKRGAKGTYAIESKSANAVKLGMVVDFSGLHITATLQVTRSGGNATLSFDGVATSEDDDPQQIHTTASGSFTYDPATGSGTITYVANGKPQTETFSQTATGMTMTLMGIPHVFTRAR